MSNDLLADTNYLLPESSYLPRHPRTGVILRFCRESMAKKDHEQTSIFGCLAKAEARDTTCLRVCRRELRLPVKSGNSVILRGIVVIGRP